MLQPIKYCLSITPKLYELAPTPEDFSIEEIEAWATTEENYAEAVVKHAAWKEAKAAAEREEKSRLAQEMQIAKVEALKQKAKEKRKAEEKRKEEEQKVEEERQEEEQLCLLKEQEDAAERKRLV